ncbi:hypothetical protein N7492_003453 [Penicillium capsulatum]|uniref:Zn(2)-C6 fungal-type domain-containing protein n=1 Tax=Penicillium capsulatum TaxID=69766 RepID=A0A9W9ILD4_9EURO|nr:hypothetical protein N7492_003453 [Penicillium capsulatum]KAJ6121965.1 hypothetical protein N7512_004430 [Penicillium capsulatum]
MNLPSLGIPNDAAWHPEPPGIVATAGLSSDESVSFSSDEERTNLVQCDRQQPHCGQCIRMREKCTGYRDEWELVFRDQTNHTIKRSRAKKARQDTPARSPASEDRTPSPVCALIPNLDEIGVNYFLHNFVIGHCSSRGYLNYLSTVYTTDGRSPTLLTTMAAVGLVALANSTRQPKLVSHARVKYWEAIQKVNLALASPTESLKDSVLMSIISLGVFENVSNFDSWVVHVQGAAALVVARGKDQFTSTASMLMFTQVRADMIVACVHRDEPFPQDMLELQDVAMNHPLAARAFWAMGILGTRHANLLWRARRNAPGSASSVLDEATVLQRDFQDIFNLLAVEEPYITVEDQDGDPDIIYNRRVDLYPSTWSIRVWNNARMLQMIVCNIIVYILNIALSKNPATAVRMQMELKVRETLQIQSKLENDMLATVPQALGVVTVNSLSNRDQAVDFCSPAGVSGGYLLTWCLYTAGQSTVVNSKTRRWIIRRLYDIGKKAGIAVALQHLEDIVKIDEARRESEEAYEGDSPLTDYTTS